MQKSVVKSREEWGPAMSALNPQQRTFVQILWESAPIGASAAARKAGYSGNKGSSEVQGHRLMHMEHVRAAILEYGRMMEAAVAPEVQQILLKIARGDQHKDQAKVAMALYARAGFNQVVEKNVNMNVTVTHQEQIAWLRQDYLAQGKTEAEIAEILGSRALIEIEGQSQTLETDDFADEEY